MLLDGANAAHRVNQRRSFMKTVRSKKRNLVPAVVSVVLSAWAPAGRAAPAQPIKNIVLVHGAFADGSSWAKVIPILQAKGYNVTAVQNPLTSLGDDGAATHRPLGQQDGRLLP